MFRERNIKRLTGLAKAYANSLNICHYVLQLFIRIFKILLSKHPVCSFTLHMKALVEILPAKKNHLRLKRLNGFVLHTKTQLIIRFKNIVCLSIFYKIYATSFLHYMSNSFSTLKLTLK